MSETKFTIGLFVFFDILFVLYYFIHPLENFGIILAIGILFEITIVSNILEHEKYIKEKREKEKYKILYESKTGSII